MENTIDCARFVTRTSVRKKILGNPLLVKDSVGKPRKSLHDLPSVDHTYGRKLKRDRENAGQVIMTWKANDSETTKENCTHGRRTKSIDENKKTPDHVLGCMKDVTFGVKTVYNENARQLITYEFGDEWTKRTAQEFEQERQREAKMKQFMKQGTGTNPTTSSKKDVGKKPPSNPKLDHSWKMKRFQNVPPRVQML